MSGRRSNLDVHLMATLDHLLRERSVTVAAERLGVSQPAVSASLAKLRRHFDDQLLVRESGHYVLTPLAETLAARTPAALAQIESVFDVAHAFDAATTEREFTVLASDHFTAVYGRAVADAVRDAAPAAGLRFAPMGLSRPGDFTSRLLEVDGIVLPRASIPDYPFVDLTTDDWVFVCAREHAASRSPLTRHHLESLPWVTFRLRGGHVPPLEFLHSQGVETRIDVLVGDFVSIPFLVTGTDRIGIVPRRLGELLAVASDTAVLESPIALPALIMCLLYHPSKETDPAHAWLRSRLAGLSS